MAVPFRRKSSKKSREGRSAENLKKSRNLISQSTVCSECKKKKVAHRICENCLTYRNNKY